MLYPQLITLLSACALVGAHPPDIAERFPSYLIARKIKGTHHGEADRSGVDVWYLRASDKPIGGIAQMIPQKIVEGAMAEDNSFDINWSDTPVDRRPPNQAGALLDKLQWWYATPGVDQQHIRIAFQQAKEVKADGALQPEHEFPYMEISMRKNHNDKETENLVFPVVSGNEDKATKHLDVRPWGQTKIVNERFQNPGRISSQRAPLRHRGQLVEPMKGYEFYACLTENGAYHLGYQSTAGMVKLPRDIKGCSPVYLAFSMTSEVQNAADLLREYLDGHMRLPIVKAKEARKPPKATESELEEYAHISEAMGCGPHAFLEGGAVIRAFLKQMLKWSKKYLRRQEPPLIKMLWKERLEGLLQQKPTDRRENGLTPKDKWFLMKHRQLLEVDGGLAIPKPAPVQREVIELDDDGDNDDIEVQERLRKIGPRLEKDAPHLQLDQPEGRKTHKPFKILRSQGPAFLNDGKIPPRLDHVLPLVSSSNLWGSETHPEPHQPESTVSNFNPSAGPPGLSYFEPLVVSGDMERDLQCDEWLNVEPPFIRNDPRKEPETYWLPHGEEFGTVSDNNLINFENEPGLAVSQPYQDIPFNSLAPAEETAPRPLRQETTPPPLRLEEEFAENNNWDMEESPRVGSVLPDSDDEPVVELIDSPAPQEEGDAPPAPVQLNPDHVLANLNGVLQDIIARAVTMRGQALGSDARALKHIERFTQGLRAALQENDVDLFFATPGGDGQDTGIGRLDELQ